MTKSGKTKNKVKEYERPKEVVKSAKTESASECLFDVEGEWPSRHDSMADAIGVSMEGHDIAEKGPLKVIIHVYLADLPCVDTIAFTFRPKMQLTLDWVDDGALVDENIPILDEDGGTSSASSANYWTGGFSIRPDLVDKPSESMFNPKLILVNSIADATPSVDKSISLALLRGRPVVYEYCEFFPVLRSPLDLAQFPFDTSTLECRFTSNDWSTSDLQFVWAKEMQDFNKTVSPSARGGPGLSEFEIIGLETAIEGFSYSQQDRYEAQSCEYPHAILRITVRRDPFSYLMRVAVVSVMLMLMEVVSFLVDAKDLGGRFSVSGTTVRMPVVSSALPFSSRPCPVLAGLVPNHFPISPPHLSFSQWLLFTTAWWTCCPKSAPSRGVTSGISATSHSCFAAISRICWRMVPSSWKS